MNLDEAQRKAVAQWVAEGMKLSEIQNRLATDLGLRMTYMEVRLLVDDLKLTPKDAEPVKTPASVLTTANVAPAPSGHAPGAKPPPAASKAAASTAPSKVSLAVDQLARPGTVVSGRVTFTDGVQAEWAIDQTGRIRLVGPQPGYRPPPADVEDFQIALETELAKLGF